MRDLQVLKIVAFLLVYICPYNHDCIAQTCGFFSTCTICVDSSYGCALKAYGIRVQLVKAIAGVPYNTFYIRVSASGTGKIINCTDCKSLTLGYDGSTNGAAFYGANLNAAQSPVGTCPTVYGSSICALPDTNGAVLTVTPGVKTQTGLNSFDQNKGSSTSLVLNTANVQEVDTGLLGRSYCDIRPSTDRGEPLNISSGNVYRSEFDAFINSGKIGNFGFERSYNSLNSKLSAFGYGWQHNFEIRVIDSSGSILVQDGSGRRAPFYLIINNPSPGLKVYTSGPGITDTLYQTTVSPITFSLKKRDGTTLTFTSISATPPNYISHITDRNSNQINFTYTSGKLTRISEPGGRYYDLVYSADSLTQLKNQAGTVLAAYNYHTAPDQKYLKRVTYGDASWVEFSYDSSSTPFKLKKILTSDNNEYFYEYDSKGRANASYRTGNVDRIDVTYERRVGTGSDADSLLAVVTDSLGNRDSLLTQPNALAIDRLLIKGRNSGCSACADSFKYDNHSNLIYKRSQLGVVDSMAYDKDDRLALRIEAKRVGGTSSFARTDTLWYGNFALVTRDSTGSVVTPTDTLTKIFQYDAYGNDTIIIESGLASTGVRYTDKTRFAYNSSGQVTKIDGPRTDIGDTSRFFYNSTTGDLDSVREFAGSTVLPTQYTSYDAFGNPLSVIGPNSDTTDYRYDTRQRVDRIIRKKGSTADTTLYQYNFAGAIRKILLPRGGGDSIKYVYDLAGRLTHIINGAGDTIVYTYDLMSNQKSETVRKGSVFKTTYFYYDPRGHLTTMKTGDTSNAALFDSTGFRYDDVGNRKMQISGRGDTTFFHYDALNRLDSVRQDHDDGVDITAYEYDLQDNLKKVIDPDSIVTTYKYSDRGHLIEETSPASGTTTYTYDPAGNLTQKIAANNDTVNYVHDALNRQDSIKYGTLSYAFDYDGSTTNNRKGRLWKETGPVATRKFSYDYAGRVARESVIVGTKTYYMNYTYDKNGNLTTLRYPDSRDVTYTYDLADRIFKVVSSKGSVTKTAMDSVRYLPFGPDTSMKLGNGIKVKKPYDKRYYMQSISNSTASIFGRSYQYDHNGNITQLLDSVDNTKSYDAITYDGVDRLLTAFGNNRTDDLTYTYAKNGNRLTKQKGSSTTTYNYVNNRLRNTTGAEVVNYGYNANGSNIGDTLGAATLTYIYDKLNRMVKITGITPADTFAYDGENRRIYSKESGVQQVNLYDIFGNLIAQYPAGSGLFITDYVWANGEPRMRIDTLTNPGLGPLAPGGPTETPYWYHTDHLGTPFVLTDSLKTIQWQISLDPFGETVSENTPVISDNLRFPGQLADRGSGLNYNWNRYYQPKIGRYYQTDFLVVKNATDEYIYVDNQPLTASDVEGDEKKDYRYVNLATFEMMLKSAIEGYNQPKFPLNKDERLFNLLSCIAARESGYGVGDRIVFRLNDENPTTKAYGLMAVYPPTFKGLINPQSEFYFPYSWAQLQADPTINIKAGMAIWADQLRRSRSLKDPVRNALAYYGGYKKGYPAGAPYVDRILSCFDCLNKKPCESKSKCLLNTKEGQGKK